MVYNNDNNYVAIDYPATSNHAYYELMRSSAATISINSQPNSTSASASMLSINKANIALYIWPFGQGQKLGKPSKKQDIS